MPFLIKSYFHFIDEEYHIAHSLFFANSCIYILLFDCSIELEKIVTQNKLLYWFHFLQTLCNVGKDSPIILVGTKVDVLEQNFGFFEREAKVKQRMCEINEILRECIEENNVRLKIDRFKIEGDDSLFFALNNREFDLQKAGISNLVNLLVSKYDDTEYSISTTLAHKLVFDTIERLRTENGVNEGSQSGKKDFIQVEELDEEIERISEKEGRREEIDAVKKNLFSILCDLSKLGVIVYFEHQLLRNKICEPLFFNNIFKQILNFGRKKVQMIVERTHLNLLILEEEFARKRNPSEKDNSLVLMERFLRWTKLKSSLSFQEIWSREEERKKSNVDKVSFHTCLTMLEQIEAKLRSEGNESAFKEFLPFEEIKHKQLSQTVFVVDEETLHSLIIQILGERIGLEDKTNTKEFLFNLLSKFDLVLPMGKSKFVGDRFALRNQTYIIPFLFPLTKPSNIPQPERKRCRWRVQYLLPFKPSSLWKLLFLRIRNACVSENSQSSRKMLSESYWVDGIFFKFTNEREEEEETILKVEIKETVLSNSPPFDTSSTNSATDLHASTCSTPNPLFTSGNSFLTPLPSSSTFSSPSLKNSSSSLSPLKNSKSANRQNQNKVVFKQTVEVELMSSSDPQLLFQSIHQAFREFVARWLQKETAHEIKMTITRTENGLRVSQTRGKVLNFSPKETTDNASFSLSSNSSSKGKGLCAFCGLSISLSEPLRECDSCNSKVFLVESHFALLDVIFQGGSGRIHKALHDSTQSFVAIKERLQDKQNPGKMSEREFEERKREELVWKREIEMLQFIEENIPEMTTCRLIHVLDDTLSGYKQKYMVMEFIEGGNLSFFEEKMLKTAKFNSQIDFVRMLLILLHEINCLHSKNIVHRFAKNGNKKFTLSNFSEKGYQG